MRRIIFSALSAASALMLAACSPENPDPAHNSENSLDWAGVYSGVLPCADCPGIETEVTLNANARFSTRYRYLERSGWYYTVGSFEWNDVGSAVTLHEGDERVSNYQVGENQLFLLDQEGKRIEGAIAPHFILRKIR